LYRVLKNFLAQKTTTFRFRDYINIKHSHQKKLLLKYRNI
jgi:hypothetical protein